MYIHFHILYKDKPVLADKPDRVCDHMFLVLTIFRWKRSGRVLEVGEIVVEVLGEVVGGEVGVAFTTLRQE